jgi:AcrR family transcriptional regulator
MAEHNVKRRYHAPRRAEQAAATRRAVLAAARELFVERGYTATTVGLIAATAGVSVDTVYATVGRKPLLLRELVETSLAALEHDHTDRIRAAATAEEKIATCAAVTTAVQLRLAPVFLALRDAAVSDPACAALWSSIGERRARTTLDFAADLRRTGRLRPDLTDLQAADVVWSMDAVEYWVLLVHERGWSPDRFRQWLADAWTKLLLQPVQRAR